MSLYTEAKVRSSQTSDFQIMHDDEPAVGLWRGGIDEGRMSHA